MDRITNSLVKDFLNLQELTSEGEPEDFENFCNYSIIANEHKSVFNFDEISTGQNIGIDGIGMIVNGVLVTSLDELNDLKDMNNYLEVTFIFIQSKTSVSFECGEMLNS